MKLEKLYGVRYHHRNARTKDELRRLKRESEPHWLLYLQARLEPDQEPQEPLCTSGRMKAAAAAFYARHQAKRHKGKFQIRQALDIVLTATGNISPERVSVDHARNMHQIIENNFKWGQTTKSNIACIARQFLTLLAIERNISTYGFLLMPLLLRFRRATYHESINV